jgi:hypothetical protein
MTEVSACRPLRLWALSLSLALTAAACSPDVPASGDAAASAPAFQVTGTIRDIMSYMVDPSSDAIWNSVVTEVTAAGVDEHKPETPEEWAALRGQTVVLMEATNLLLMEGRRVAPEGTRSALPGVDLEPEQIEALLADNRAAWMAFVGGLHDAGGIVLDAIDHKDVDALLAAGDGLDLACENCHVRYWYPDQGTQSSSR